MSTTIIDYEFKAPSVANPNGQLPTTLPADAQILAGPGPAAGRNLPKAVKVKTAPIRIDIGSVPIPDATRFRVRVVFCVDKLWDHTAPVQTLVESRRLPFKLQLKGEANNVVKLICSVQTRALGYRTTQAYPLQAAIKPNEWHTTDLIFDVDTLGLLFDGWLNANHGFGPNGAIALNLSEKFVFVGGEDNASRFQGRIAWLFIELGFNGQWENYINEHRSTPQWYMTTAAETLRPTINAGEPIEFAAFDQPSGSWKQAYQDGAIMYNPSGASAFHIHGLIWERYSHLTQNIRESLGYLASNEMPSSSDKGRKSLFQGGGIYWSPNTPATEVVGQIYLAYGSTGDTDAWGFPLGPSENIPGGTVQRMQFANIYFQDGAASAHEVNGDILAAYLAQGGPSKWGFPVSNELDVPGFVKATPGGGIVFDVVRPVRVSQFERASVYWSVETKAHFIYGDIRDRWLKEGGPKSPLGLPTTDEMDIPGGGRMSGFERGVITWYGSADSVRVVGAFRIFIGVINSEETEGFGQGQNDIYFNSNIKKGSAMIFARRFPDRGAWDGNNIKTFNQKIGPSIVPDPFTAYSFTLQVNDEDGGFGGRDDALGTWTVDLNAANSWGFRNNMGILNSGRVQPHINNISAAVQQDVDIKTLRDDQKFFAIKNVGVDPLDYPTYAEAFRNVDSSPEVWDPLDWLDKTFYELFAKHLAKKGRCFGITAEAINSHIGSSVFSQPLDRFNNWDIIGHTLAVKHQYQVGAASCWNFVGNFLSGRWRDPKSVFDETERLFNTGNWPTLNISQGADFTGAPHTIMPFAWDRSVNPHVIKVHDSNFSGPGLLGFIPGGIRDLQVDFNTGAWHYDGGNVYSGSATSGGRLYFTPWSTISSVPRTPVAEAVVLLIAGTIVILGDDTETVSLQGKNGENLDAHSAETTTKLQAGQRADRHFVRHPIAGALENPQGNFLLTRGHQNPTLPANGPVPSQTLFHLNPIIQPMGDELSIPRLNECWFKHTIRGKNNGVHQQLIKAGGTHINLNGPIAAGETSVVNATKLNTTSAEVTWQNDRAKQAELTVMHRHGMSRDAVMMKFELATTKAGTVTVQHRPGLATVVLDTGDTKVSSAKLTVTTAKSATSSTYSYDLIALAGAHGTLDTQVRIKLTPGSQDGRISLSNTVASGPVMRGQKTASGTPVAVNVNIPEVDPPQVPR